MCQCNKGGSGRRYKVTYPGGKFAIKNTLADAELAKAKVPGAKIEKMR